LTTSGNRTTGAVFTDSAADPSAGAPPVNKVDLAAKLALFSDHWAPRTVARLNGFDVMVVKVLGKFVWHAHDDTTTSSSSSRGG